MSIAVIPHYPPYGGSLGPVAGFKTYLRSSTEKYEIISFRWGKKVSCFEEEKITYFNYPWSIAFIRAIRAVREPNHIYFRSLYTLDFLIGSLFKNNAVNIILSSSGKFMPMALAQKSFLKKLILFFYLKVLKRINEIYFQSYYERSQAPDFILRNSKCRIVPQKFLEFSDPINGDQIYFYTFSRVDPWKGLEGIILKYAKTECNIPLNIIGPAKESYIKELKEYCSSLKIMTGSIDDMILHKGVNFLGYMDKDELRSVLTAYKSVFIQNSRSEGVSNSALEAVINGSVLCLNRAVSNHLEIKGIVDFDELENLNILLNLDFLETQKQQLSSFRNYYVAK